MTRRRIRASSWFVPKSDLAAAADGPEGSFAVSSVTGEGLSALLERIEELARSVLPAEDAMALNRRQALHIGEAADALEGAAASPGSGPDRRGSTHGAAAFDRLTGRAGVEDVLDALFGRFCLGK